jgi:predicted metal-binding protein
METVTHLSFMHGLHRRRINQIHKIKDETGRELKNIKEINSAFIGFYQGLLTVCSTCGVEMCLVDMRRYITKAMNVDLLKQFAVEEIVAGFRQMHPFKSPGLDGFSTCFYQRS